MKMLRNERGMALVTSLLLTLISLTILMAVMYLITRGTQVSAAHKRYKTALEASRGGLEVFTKEVIARSVNASTAPALDGLLSPQFSNYSCFHNKLTTPTGQWAYTGDAKSTNPKVAADLIFTLQGVSSQPNFKVYSKVVDTVPGNSDTSGTDLLDSGAGVAYGSSGVSPEHVPAVYRIEVQGERENNPQEKARLTVLYAY